MTGAPVRPAIAPVAWFALAMWAGSSLAEGVSWALWSDVPLTGTLVVAMAATAGAGFVAWRRPGARPVLALVLAGVISGLGVSGLQSAAWHRQIGRVADCGAREWTGVVEADPMPGAFGSTVRVKVTGGPLDKARVRVRWPEEVPVPDLGRTVRFAAVLKPLPAGEAWARRVARAGACATGSAWRAQVGEWRPGIAGTLLAWRAGRLEAMHDVGGPGGDLLEGIVLGDRRRLVGTPADEDFRILGLTHLVAVSGSHLALACGAVAAIGAMLRVPRRPLTIATVAAGAAYALVTGMPYSALRSLLMLVIAGIGTLSGRRGDGIASLSAAAVCVLAIEPWSVFDIGFQLSALAVAGLLLFGTLATVWGTTGTGGIARLAASTLALTFVAQIMTVPVVGATFGMVSLLAPVANALAAAPISLALWFGLGGTVVGGVLPALGDVAVELSAAVLGATAWVASGLARLPGAAIAVDDGLVLVVGPVAAVVGVWAWWPLPSSVRSARVVQAGAVLLTVALGVGPAPGRATSVVTLDVGQGDAILVRDGGRTMLVDTGPDPVALRRALARHGVRHIDVLVLTHAHDDHTGGAPGLSGTVGVGWVGVPQVGRPDTVSADHPASDERTGPASMVAGVLSGRWAGPDAQVRVLAAGDTWRVGATVVRVLWPPSEPVGDLGTNDTSVVLQLERGGFDAVLTGDTEERAQHGMLEAGDVEKIELLKVPHHGSSNGLTAEALSVWSPAVAVISVGEGNSFGHPSASVLQMLDESGALSLRTDLAGDITAWVTRSGLRMSVQRRGERAAVRARMAKVRRDGGCAVHGTASDRREGVGGHQGYRGLEVRLPDLRRGEPLARARPPPPSRPRGHGGRSRLQLRCV